MLFRSAGQHLVIHAVHRATAVPDEVVPVVGARVVLNGRRVGGGIGPTADQRASSNAGGRGHEGSSGKKGNFVGRQGLWRPPFAVACFTRNTRHGFSGSSHRSYFPLAQWAYFTPSCPCVPRQSAFLPLFARDIVEKRGGPGCASPIPREKQRRRGASDLAQKCSRGLPAEATTPAVAEGLSLCAT